jgi:DNA-binding protein HU-beta
MSRAFIAEIIQESTGVSKMAANTATADLIDAIVKELKREGTFQIPSFGTFRVRRTAARKGRNPYTGETIKIRAAKTVRFKPSPTLKKSV